MGINSIIVLEYLESLKEDTELDYLFPLLLSSMNYKIISTPKDSKGQSQYGKDIIATGKDLKDGINKRFYFELKGHDDRDITDRTLNKDDGIIASLRAAKYTKYEDSSIVGFNELPIKYVLVHNGTIKTNAVRTWEGFVKEEFPNGNLERWDINKLSDLFCNHLFNEYLFTDKESLRLFKKTLALLDAPDYNFSEFKQLVDIQINKVGTYKKGRLFKKFFATQNLLANVLIGYCREIENLEPAKNCISYLILKTWSWILLQKIENQPSVKREFSKLIEIHFDLLSSYFDKTLTYATKNEGLFAENGGSFEEIGYPLRCFEYLNYLIYYFKAKEHLKTKGIDNLPMLNKHKDVLIELVKNNEAFNKPLLDNHSIAINNLILFFLSQSNSSIRKEDLEFIAEYIVKIFENIILIEKLNKRFPLLNNNEKILARTIASGKKVRKYEDSSSLLILILFEYCAILRHTYAYETFKSEFEDRINLQTVHPNIQEFEIEEIMFRSHMDQEYYNESDNVLGEDLNEFRKSMIDKTYDKIEFRTDKAGFSFLRTLAHVYFKNEQFPFYWRELYNK